MNLEPNSSGQSKQYATFSVGDLFFGIEVLQVQEVLRYLEMTKVPLAPTAIEGLINLRGQIVTAVDMRARLGLPKRPEGQSPMNLVVRSEEGAVSLLVDEIGDVLEVREDAYEPVPENISPERKDVVSGIYKLEGRLLLVLDTERALRAAVTN